MIAGCKEIKQLLKRRALEQTGPWFTHHHRRPTDTFDYEICFPVATAVEPEGRVINGFWAATRVARTIFHGNYAQLAHSWSGLHTWMTAQGLAGREEFWEAYLVSPIEDPNPEHWRTQLNWPLV